MPNYTQNLNLEKPLENENYNIEVFNNNAEKIDGAINEVSNKVDNFEAPVKSINNKTGAVTLVAADIKTTDGKTLEQFKTDASSQLEQIPKTNYTASVAPASSDDTTKGYKNGSLWLETSSKGRIAYICLSPTAGEAVWGKVSEDLNAIYYYHLGDEKAEITNGWVEYKVFGSYTIEKKTTYLSLYSKDTGESSPAYSSASYRTLIKVSLANIKKICVDWEQSSAGTSNQSILAVLDTEGTRPEFSTTKLSLKGKFSRQISEYDVSALSGDYYIVVANYSGDNLEIANTKVYSVWGEK